MFRKTFLFSIMLLTAFCSSFAMDKKPQPDTEQNSFAMKQKEMRRQSNFRTVRPIPQPQTQRQPQIQPTQQRRRVSQKNQSFTRANPPRALSNYLFIAMLSDFRQEKDPKQRCLYAEMLCESILGKLTLHSTKNNQSNFSKLVELMHKLHDTIIKLQQEQSTNQTPQRLEQIIEYSSQYTVLTEIYNAINQYKKYNIPTQQQPRRTRQQPDIEEEDEDEDDDENEEEIV